MKNNLRIVVVAIVCMVGAPVVAYGYMQGASYNVWIDSLGSGGGAVTSADYRLDSVVGAFAPGSAESGNFTEISGIQGIEAEPFVSFSVVTAEIAFGKLSPLETATDTIELVAATNIFSGYHIRAHGEPLHSATHTIRPLSDEPTPSLIGKEQFGLNVVKNTIPLVGALPVGGIGRPTEHYGEQNKFYYVPGTIIATSPTFSDSTTYTVSVITNISPATPTGSYGARLSFTMTPTY